MRYVTALRAAHSAALLGHITQHTQHNDTAHAGHRPPNTKTTRRASMESNQDRPCRAKQLGPNSLSSPETASRTFGQMPPPGKQEKLKHCAVRAHGTATQHAQPRPTPPCIEWTRPKPRAPCSRTHPAGLDHGCSCSTRGGPGPLREPGPS